MPDRPLLVDLFSGAGGCAMGYHRAGFDVFGIDAKAQPNYPFDFLRQDALEILATWKRFTTYNLKGRPVAAIHASPPCQSYLNLGSVNLALGRRYEHQDLIAATRELLVETGVPYVIENVPDAKPHLIEPVRVCGTAFGRPLRRHRLFESTVPLGGLACNHQAFTEKKYWTSWRPGGEHRLSTVVQVYGNGSGRDEWGPAMGIDWMTNAEMAEAVPPDYTEFIGKQLLEHLSDP